MTEEMTWTELVNDGNTPKVEPKPWMKKRKFIRIESVEQLKKVVDQAIEAGHCALDLETTGLDNRIDQSGKTMNDIVGYCLAFNGTTGYYAPVGHVYTDQGDNSAPHPANIDDLEAALEIKRLCKNCVTIYHNSPFDLEFLRGLGHQYGFEVDDPDMFEDTLILDYLKDSTQKRHGLKYLSKEYLNWEMIELKELFMDDDLNFAKLDPTAEETLWYACPDAICTWALFQWYRFHDYKGRKPAISEYPAVINEQQEIYQIEKSLVPALRWMERNRPKVDRQYTHSILKEAEEYQNELIRDIEKEFCQEIKRDDGALLFLDEEGEPKYEVFRNTFEVTSPAQLGKAMEALKENNSAFANVELEYTEKSDQVRTDNDYIEYLAKRYGDRFPLFQKIQNYRSLQKAVSTYIKPIHQNTDHDEYNPETEKTGNENLDQKIQDNTIRFRFRAWKVDTGRFAADKGRPEFGSSGINVQSTPACYNYAKFQTRKINSRPEGEGDPDAELANGYVQAKQNTDFLKRVHDNHFVTDNKTGDEHCIRKDCEGCPFFDECNHETPQKKMFYSLEAAVRPSIRARDGYVMVACVKEGGLVATDRGLIPIEGVTTDDKVITEKGWKDVDNVQKTGHRKTVTIQTAKGFELEVTSDHLVRTTDAEKGLIWKEAGDLKPDDWIVQIGDYLNNDIEPVQLPETVDVGNGSKKITTPECMSPELAQFLGHFMRDGCLGHRNGVVKYVGVALGGDIDELLPVVNHLSTTLFGHRFKRKEKGDAHLWSRNLGEWLEQVTQKGSKDSNTYEVPECILRSGRQHVSMFLRGLFDADGYVSDNTSHPIAIWMTSESFSQQVQQLLLGLGIPSRRTYKERTTNYGKTTGHLLTISGPNALKQFRREIGFVCARKQARLKKLVNERTSRNLSNFIPYDLAKQAVVRQRNVFTNRLHTNGRKNNRVTKLALEKAAQHPDDINQEWMNLLLEKGLLFDRIKSIDDNEKITAVYDITVPEARHFQANGFVVHNCDYASLELRVAANICEEPRWIEEYYRCGNCNHEFEQPEKQPDGRWILKEKPSARCPKCGSDKIGDLHTLTARIIYGDEILSLPDSDFKQKRQDGKSTNFAVVYMGGPSTIARNLGASFERGKEIRNAVFNQLDTFSKWINRTVAKAQIDEEVETTSGRKIRLNDINHEEKWIREKQKRNAVNSIVQGSATGDLVKYAMGEIYKDMRERDWLDVCRLMLTMHDELVFEIRKDMLDEVLPVIDHNMTKYADEKGWAIPLITDIEFGLDWGAKYDWREMHNTFVEGGIAADPVPQFLVNHIKFEEGMWYEDESTEEKRIWDGASFVSEEKFLGTEEDPEKSDNSIEEDTEMSDNSDTSKADEEGQKLVKDFTEADMPENHTEYDIHDHTIYNALATDRGQLSFEVSLGKIKRASKAMEVLGMGKRTHALRIVSATGNILVNPNQRLVLVNPEIFEILAFYEGL